MITPIERRQLNAYKGRANKMIECFKKLIELEASGSEDGIIEKDKILEIIEKMIHEEELQTGRMLKDEREQVIVRSIFPQPDEVLVEDDRIKLIAFSDAYKDLYIDMLESEEKTRIYRNLNTRDTLFKSCVSPVSLHYAVCNKVNGKYMGYVAINDIKKSVWEVSVELLEEYRYQGFGGEALRLMLDRVSEISGETIFRCRVYPDNYASQAMFKKLGAKQNGIFEHILCGSDIKQFEEDNLKLIDENIVKVAEEFRVEPRKLLSHVLEYIVEWRVKDEENA